MKKITAVAIVAGMFATTSLADKPAAEPSSKATPSKAKVSSCEWTANHDFMPPRPARLSVTGTCEAPTPGYKLSLVRTQPQGTNPAILLLTLQVQPPSGIVNKVITKTTVDPYEEKTSTHYKSVTILPAGDSVPVKETQ